MPWNQAEKLLPKSFFNFLACIFYWVLDGISLKPLIDGSMRQRSSPICFWSYRLAKGQSSLKPYIDPKLQQGTTPLVKKMGGRLTRNFQNYHHPTITQQDFAGARAILDNRYKLVIHDSGAAPVHELFDMRSDQAEKDNLLQRQPEVARKLQRQLRDWQQSVLTSLTGADYRP